MLNKINNVFSLLDKKNKYYLFLVIFFAFISSALDLIGVVSVIPFLSLLVDPNLLEQNLYLRKLNSFLQYDNDQLLIFLGAISFISIFINQLIRFIYKMISINFSRKLIYEMSLELFNFYLKQPYSFFSKQNKSLLIQKCTSYVENLISGTVAPYTLIFSQILTTSIILIFLLFYQPSIIIVLTTILLSYYFLFYKKVSKKYNQISKNYSKYF